VTKENAPRRPGGRRHRRGLSGLVAVGVVLAGCASGSVAVTAGATTKPNNRVALSSLTLRMGDQFKSVQTLLQTSGELKNLPFHITWSDFPSGSSGVAALTGGSIDAIPTADAPALFAYAAHAPVKVVSASLPSKPTESIYGVMVPANSSIRKLSDLAGKSAGWETGSVGQYFALQALKKAHVRSSSVTFVNLTAANALSALNSGKVDALFSSDPYLSIGQALFHDKVIASGAPYVGSSLLCVGRSAHSLSRARSFTGKTELPRGRA